MRHKKPYMAFVKPHHTVLLVIRKQSTHTEGKNKIKKSRGAQVSFSTQWHTEKSMSMAQSVSILQYDTFPTTAVCVHWQACAIGT